MKANKPMASAGYASSGKSGKSMRYSSGMKKKSRAKKKGAKRRVSYT